MPHKPKIDCIGSSQTPLGMGKRAEDYKGESHKGCDGSMYNSVKWGRSYRWNKKNSIIENVKNENISKKTKIVKKTVNSQRSVQNTKEKKENEDIEDIALFIQIQQSDFPVFQYLRKTNKKTTKGKIYSAESAISYMKNLVKDYKQTKSCKGLHVYNWFDVLLKSQNFDIRICSNDVLKIRLEKKGFKFSTPWDHLRKKCHFKKEGVELVPLDIILLKNGHRNQILIDHRKKTVELFDPNGYSGDEDEDLLQDVVLAFLSDRLLSYIGLEDYEFINPYDACDIRLGPQRKSQASNMGCVGGGYCVTFSQVYAHLRLLAPDEPPSETIKTLNKLSDSEIADLIRKYIEWQLSLFEPTFAERLRQAHDLHR